MVLIVIFRHKMEKNNFPLTLYIEWFHTLPEERYGFIISFDMLRVKYFLLIAEVIRNGIIHQIIIPRSRWIFTGWAFWQKPKVYEICKKYRTGCNHPYWRDDQKLTICVHICIIYNPAASLWLVCQTLWHGAKGGGREIMGGSYG